MVPTGFEICIDLPELSYPQFWRCVAEAVVETVLTMVVVHNSEPLFYPQQVWQTWDHHLSLVGLGLGNFLLLLGLRIQPGRDHLVVEVQEVGCILQTAHGLP